MSESKASIKSGDESASAAAAEPSEPVGRMVVEYLSKRQDGASFTNIIRHLQKAGEMDQADLADTVMSLLKNGTSLGFLERDGSRYKNWTAREVCGRRRKRRKSCCCRRKIRRRRSCRKKRIRRC